MDTPELNKTPILEVAWRKFAQYDDASVKRTATFTDLRRWILIFGVIATLLSILVTVYPGNFPKIGSTILKVLLVLAPIVTSLLAAIGNQFFSTGDWLVARAGAEEMLKDIYIYRTILKTNPKRRQWLEKRLENIQRSVFRGMNGELAMEVFKGSLPPSPRFSPEKPDCDNGFSDLSGDEYFKYRLENELRWHEKKVIVKRKERFQLQVWIYILGGIGAAIAGVAAFSDSNISVWVALTASLTSALSVWQQLKNLEQVVRNYSKVILELGIIADHWKNLEAEERTQTEVNRMVRSTEDILWSRNVEYIKAMQEALKESNLDEEASLINRVIQEQKEADSRFRKNIEDTVVDETTDALESATDKMTETFKEAFGSLAEEASSDIVQAELEAMKEAIQNLSLQLAQKLGLSNSLQSIAEDFKEVPISGETPRGVLNDLLSRYPKSSEVKG